MPAQPGVIRPSALTQTISVITRPAPPSALPPRCTRWKSDGIPSRAEYMSIADTTTRLARSSDAQPERLEHRRHHLARAHARAACSAPANQASIAVGELRIAQAQVGVGDPAAAGHDVERELLGLLAGVLAEVLEPLQAGLRRALGGGDHRPPLGLVGSQRGLDAGAASRR